MTKTIEWEKAKEYVMNKSQSGAYDCAGDIEGEINELAELLESARREVIDEIIKKSFEDDNGCYGKIIRMDDVLSTLRKEDV